MSYPNDDFANATTLTGSSGSITPFHYDGVTDPATNEASEDYVGAGETLWWKWTVPFTGRAFATTRFSTSDDSDPSGLDTKIQIFADFATSLGSNDDDPDPPSGSYDFNSYLSVDIAAGDTIYIQVDQYGAGQAGTIHLAWGQEVDPDAPVVGPWIYVSAATSEAEVQDTFHGGTDDYYWVSLGYVAGDSATWESVSEGENGIGDGLAHVPPKRPTYAVVAQVGEYSTGDWADSGIDPPDEILIELNPFDLEWNSKVEGIQLPAFTLPAHAIGWEYAGFPHDTYGLSYRPHVDTDWVTASAIRAVLEINRAQEPTGDVIQTATGGWSWDTAPVAGLAGPQHIVFRYDGVGITNDEPFTSLEVQWDHYGGLTTTIFAAAVVDNVSATFDATIEVGSDEVLTFIDAGAGGVHWEATYTEGWTDYQVTNAPGAGDTYHFIPAPMTVQVRMLNIDGGSRFRSGVALAAAPLMYEHTSAGTLNETVDTGWLDLDVSVPVPSAVYLNYAEQISHTSPAPDPLPARKPRHHHYLTTYDYYDGNTTLYGSTVAFERPESGGTYERMLLRITYQPPAHRFIYAPDTVLTIPPLRQFHRDDGLAGGARSQVNPTSRQASQRQGINGTYL